MYEGLTFCFDIDGTLCPIKKKEEEYIDLVPYGAMLDKLREYKEGGAKIVLFTSRNMNSYNGNIGLINANGRGTRDFTWMTGRCALMSF